MTKNEIALEAVLARLASADPFSIRSSGLPAGARVAGFHGTEGISRCYAFDVHVITEGDEVEVEASIGSRATLSFNVPGELPTVVHGVLAEIEHVREVHESGSSTSTSLYRARIVPSLWFLGLTRHSRIFTHKSIIEVICDVLEAEGIASDDYELRLAGVYPVEEHVCQYKESSLAFISRWMEREGLVYFFEHLEDRERLVITDHKRFHTRCPLLRGPVRYHPTSSKDWGVGRHFDNLAVRKTSTAATVRLTEYDYARPNLDLSAVAPVEHGYVGEIAGYGDRYFSPEDAKRLAGVRSEELRANALVYLMTGCAPRLRAGYQFDIEHHPRATYNMTYLALEVEHFGYSDTLAGTWGQLVEHAYDDTYRVQVCALPAAIQYRFGMRTPHPRIDGYENGQVDGEKDSEYAQIDDQGRYRMKLKFDEGTLKNGKASTWVRMMQPHGGGAEGFHFPLRKATEVLCAFLGGDPDRLVIIGVVPNVLTPSPVTNANHTQNILQTGGETYMCIDDQKGSKFASLMCPYVPGMEAELYLGHPRPNGGAGLTLPSGPQRAQVGQFATPIESPNFHLRTTGTGMVSSTGPLDVSSGGALQLESDTSILLYSPTLMQHTAGPHQVFIEGTSTENVVGKVDQTFGSSWRVDVTGGVEHRFRSLVEQTYEGPHLLTVQNPSDQTFKTGLRVNVASGDELHDVKPSFYLRAAIDIGLTAQQEVRVFGENEVDVHSPKKIELSTAGGARIVLDHDTILIEAKRIIIDAADTMDVLAKETIDIFAATGINVVAAGGDLSLRGGPMVKINT